MDKSEEAAIKRGNGKWGDPSVPKYDWVCEDIEDHEDTEMVCQMCEIKHIRYEHRMAHPDYPDVLGVGRVCAGHLERDMDAAIARQKDAVRAAQQRMRQRTADLKRKAEVEIMLANIPKPIEIKMDERAMVRASATRSLKGWHETRSTGNPILFCLDFRAVVFPKKGGFGYMVTQGDDPPTWGKAIYREEELAKDAAREALLDTVVAHEMEQHA